MQKEDDALLAEPELKVNILPGSLEECLNLLTLSKTQVSRLLGSSEAKFSSAASYVKMSTFLAAEPLANMVRMSGLPQAQL